MSEPTLNQGFGEREDARRKYHEMLAQIEPHKPNPNAISEANPRFKTQESLPAFVSQPNNTDLPTSREVYRLREIENLFGPNYIVRVARRLRTTNKPVECNGDNYDELVAEGEEQTKVLIDLIETYSIHLPPCYFVVGKTRGFRPSYDEFSRNQLKKQPSYSLFQSVEKVAGRDLNDFAYYYKAFGNEAIMPDQSLVDQLDKLICSLIDYLITHIRSKEPFIYDMFKLTQFVYGTTEKNAQPRLYLVDTEVLLEEMTVAAALDAIENVSSMLNKLENLMGISLNNSHIKRLELRQAFIDFDKLS